jgi:hypothetical protein
VNNIVQFFVVLPGFPFAWLYFKLFERKVSGFGRSLGMAVLAMFIGAAMWLLLALGLVGYGIYRAISG